MHINGKGGDEMNNKFKKIISSLILALMVILTPVEVFAQERNTTNEPAKQEIKESSERSSRHKRSIDRDGDGQEDRYGADIYGHGGGGGGVPRNAYTVAEKVISNNGKAPYGYVGGDVYKNKGLKLPTNTTYREYDVNPYSHGQNRGSERIVIGGNGSVWYTSDHYDTFIQMK